MVTVLNSSPDIHRYDYLEFTDSRGGKVRYDMKVGSEKWPKVCASLPSLFRVVVKVLKKTTTLSFFLQKVTFDAGPQLQFLFHSDSSNNEWGYKFTATALGLPDITLSWMSDLQLLVARLMGRLASRTLALKSPYGETACSPNSTNLETNLLNVIFPFFHLVQIYMFFIILVLCSGCFQMTFF